jgi:outer membrane protein assembly factor BamB
MAETTCIEPGTGKVLWKVEGAVHMDESGCVALTEDYLVCSGDARKGKSGMQCYKISAQGASRIWALGPEVSVKQFASPVIYKGHIYTRADPERGKSGMVCVDLLTGKVVGKAESGGSCNEVVGADGRVFYESSYQGPAMFKADPKDFRLLSSGTLKALDFACSVPPAIVEGRMYYRSNRYGIMCLDLRKGSTEGRLATEAATAFEAEGKKGSVPSGTKTSTEVPKMDPGD